MGVSRSEQLKKLLDLKPNAMGFFGLGRAYMDEGHYREAAEAFRRAIELKPDYTAVYLLLGESLQKLDCLDEAVQIYEQGIQVAEQTRDMVPKQKMQSRVKRLKRDKKASREK